MHYEYGRSLGVQCFWGLAEMHLLKALELDRQTGGPEYMILSELSQLKKDQKQYDKAVNYYERAIRALEKFGAPDKAPIAFADTLDEFAVSLQNIGKETEARPIRDRAIDLRKRNPKGYSISDRTPYGTQCISNND